MQDNKINHIIIPMAGLGKRFRKENFNTIKPLILVDKDTILEKSIKDLPEAKQKFIILNEKVFSKRLVQKILSKNSFEPILLKKKLWDRQIQLINYTRKNLLARKIV